MAANTEFDIRGVHHLALVCKDMAKTVAFYRDVLGMPLTKTINLSNGGQHFFFDIGNGDCIAFFWLPNAPPAAPGLAAPLNLPTRGDITSVHGSMNHIAFNVPAEKFEEYHRRLIEKGIDVTRILEHDNSPSGVAAEFNDDVYVRSMYFFDPDGACLEFAAWTRPLRDDEARDAPMTAAGVPDHSMIPA
ncbi:MAG: VOC family protein [Pseudomonadota bacterium]|uniref:VOC family protein n=1 Tax=unclassified Phenylobacterium TaxID=2640670 RepID=UPI0006FCE459|nr:MULTISPECIES: VOC family protein [unclassified Phenylobacterium]KRB41006.1 glyoxalase [Phenylobacterium sp. Root700]MBT9470166.1 VOC family protein [Phenylobacterium sp.]